MECSVDACAAVPYRACVLVQCTRTVVGLVFWSHAREVVVIVSGKQ